tara:strand:+ start:5513 stop:6268 length:756 start_codon:yes stop_codon:yes gene_type:complete
MAFCAIPAIDIKKGSCVRLKQGEMRDATIYSTDPVQMAKRWISQNATRIHVVDLDGAFSGNQKNFVSISKILQECRNKLSIQVGGGIRDLQTIKKLIELGASYVVIGTAAIKNPIFLKKACSTFPGKIIVSIDGRDGKVATDGWSKTTDLDVIKMAKSIDKLDVKNILYTDISRDGMQVGINITSTLRLAEAVTIPVIASGGLSSAAEIDELAALHDKGVDGVILGKALYEGNICLEKVYAKLKKGSNNKC